MFHRKKWINYDRQVSEFMNGEVANIVKNFVQSVPRTVITDLRLNTINSFWCQVNLLFPVNYYWVHSEVALFSCVFWSKKNQEWSFWKCFWGHGGTIRVCCVTHVHACAGMSNQPIRQAALFRCIFLNQKRLRARVWGGLQSQTFLFKIQINKRKASYWGSRMRKRWACLLIICLLTLLFYGGFLRIPRQINMCVS